METNLFFDESIVFQAWSTSHLVTMAIEFGLGFIIILWAKYRLSSAQQDRVLLVLSSIPLLSFVVYSLCRLLSGTYDTKADLPIHVCRILALGAPLVYYYKNKFWTGIFYFWIMVGTLNAVLTPDIRFDFPHWEHIVYFLMHVGLVILPLYYIIVGGYRVRRVDLWNAYWMANVFLLFSLVFNYLFESNYMFTRHKPIVPTVLDYMGPWPWYLVTVQFLALVLFIIVYLPFIKRRKKG